MLPVFFGRVWNSKGIVSLAAATKTIPISDDKTGIIYRVSSQGSK